MSARLWQRIRNRIRRSIYRPHVDLERIRPLVRMGSAYGSWSFLDHPGLVHATIVSAGLGEDASFDVEFATKYQGKVLIIDPTPRAVTHFNALMTRMGRAAEQPYRTDGALAVESYDLSKLSPANFALVEKALWKEETTVQFFQPPNPHHVSYSITNFQNSYAQDTPHIEVAAVTVKNLLAAHGLSQLELIKLDIEGAATEVLYSMFRDNILPNQILVEFDELSIPSMASRETFRVCDAVLRQNGYHCFYWNGRADFAYAHERLLKQLA